jgi:putative ABC transport system ATP-binding protein
MKFELQHIVPDPLKGEAFLADSVWNQKVGFGSPEKILLNASSGKGKSTFINILYGLRKDYSGGLIINEKPVEQYSIHDWIELRRGDLSFIPQDLQLFHSSTVLENLILKNKLTHQYNESIIIEMLERLGIGDKLHQSCGTLSMGQQQRVAIIRSLLQPFTFLLMDEPFSHLDEKNTAIAMNLINEVTEERGAGYVLTSLGSNHDQTFNRELNI